MPSVKAPKAPKNKSKAQKYTFFGAIASSVNNNNVRIERILGHSKSQAKTARAKYRELHEKIEDTHIRINKKVYKDDYEVLEGRVAVLETENVANSTQWATAKTFIGAAWAVFGIVFAFANIMLLYQVNTYTKKIDKNEEDLVEVKNEEKIDSIWRLEHKNKQMNMIKQSKDIKSELTYIKKTVETNQRNVKDLGQKVKRIKVQ
jgi:hypothetical protein